MVVNRILLTLLLLCCWGIQATQEKKLVIIITTYNNAQWCVKNLETIFFQKNPDNTNLYENYRVIIIDDASLDGNAEFIECYVNNCGQEHRVTLIKNKTRKRALANLYNALQLCEPNEIVFNYDGDDWFADDQVFALINEIYQDPDVWITYGSFINWPTNQMGYCKEISAEMVEKKLFRKKSWLPGQLRTFYAWLFHQVKLKDLFFEGPYYQGQFFPANADLAIYYPMMEMAGKHYYYISKVIYIRNVETPLNDFKANKEVQLLGSKLIREKEPYDRLEEPLVNYFDKFSGRSADIIIFSKNPQAAHQLLESCKHLVRNYNSIKIIYDASNPIIAKEYQALEEPCVRLFAIKKNNFKEQFLKLLDECQDYIVLAHDSMIFCKYFDCSQAIFSLEKTFGYSVYLALDVSKTISIHDGMAQPVPALNQINATMNSWAFHYADTGEWRRYNTFDGAIYRTQTLKKQIQLLIFNTFYEMREQWSKIPVSLEEVGLCYESAKINYIQTY